MTDKDKIMYIRHSQIVTDPFPDHSMYNSLNAGRSKIEAFFGINANIPQPEPISIWKAYRLGYEKAYEEILKGIK